MNKNALHLFNHATCPVCYSPNLASARDKKVKGLVVRCLHCQYTERFWPEDIGQVVKLKIVPHT